MLYSSQSMSRKKNLPLLAIIGLIAILLVVAYSLVNKVSISSRLISGVTHATTATPSPMPLGTFPELYPGISWSAPEKFGPSVFYADGPQPISFTQVNMVNSLEQVTEASWREAQGYYDRELKKRGWTCTAISSGFYGQGEYFYAKDPHYFSFHITHGKDDKFYGIYLQYTN
jgi:hypothetical protein